MGGRNLEQCNRNECTILKGLDCLAEVGTFKVYSGRRELSRFIFDGG